MWVEACGGSRCRGSSRRGILGEKWGTEGSEEDFVSSSSGELLLGEVGLR